MLRVALALAVAAVALAALPASASAASPRVIDSYCSPSGDYCHSVFVHRGMLKLEMRQFPLRGPYAICVKPPRSKRTCKLFRWRRSGPILVGRVTAARHFPLARRGRHRVAWFYFAGRQPLRVGRVLEFRRR